MLPSGQRRDEHDERALREVKIRDECIQAFELITGVDENIRPAGLCAQCSVGLGKALDRAAGSRTDADDAAAARLRLVDDTRRFLRNDAKLRVHRMIFDLILLDRTERAKTDVQRDIAEPYAHVRDLLQELLRKVQTGRRCGCAAELTGIDRLVAFLILQACDERVMGLGTSALIHNMWMSVDGNAKELRKAADDLDTLMESNRQIFLEKSNLEEQQLIDMMEAETFLTPEKALEYGLIDKVLTTR